MGRARTLAQVYRRFGEVDAAETSPLYQAAAGRALAWVSVEGVGVAPAIPTFGDRRASGHSILGLAVFDQSALHAQAIGRCWSRGRLLAWPADS